MNLVDLVGQLPIHPTKRYTRRLLSAIEQLVLHHAAGPERQTPEQIARFHVDVRGWPGVAYHYLIAVDGTAFKCWAATTVTYCVKGENTKSLCVCLIGNRSVVAPPAGQWGAAVELFRQLREAYGGLVLGHNEALPGHTECPGTLTDMARFRSEVMEG